MHWSTLLVLSAGLAAPQANVAPLQFSSYTQAYHAAGANHKPMLVVINPVDQPAITVEQLQSNPAIGPLLDHYVVAVVDAGTEHGQEVHRRFQSPTLPFAAVIDERQQKQVFRSTAATSLQELEPIVTQYKDGVPETRVSLKVAPFGDCPNCRRNLYSF
ncbi:MAG: hypothetical protein ACK5Q5_00820 [Planctomycetaceae bacterium]